MTTIRYEWISQKLLGGNLISIWLRNKMPRFGPSQPLRYPFGIQKMCPPGPSPDAFLMFVFGDYRPGEISIWDITKMRKMDLQQLMTYPFGTKNKCKSRTQHIYEFTIVFEISIANVCYHFWEWTTLTMDLYWSLPDHLAFLVSPVGAEHAHHGPVLVTPRSIGIIDIPCGSGARSPWTCIGHSQITWHYRYHLRDWSMLTMDPYWSFPDQLALPYNTNGYLKNEYLKNCLGEQ
jgi:hypothetical protein